MNLAELLARIEAIRARATELRALDTLGEAESAELSALVEERRTLVAKVADARALDELEQNAPEVSAEDADEATEEAATVEEEAPAEAPSDAPAESEEAAEETPDKDAIAASLSGVQSDNVIDLTQNKLAITASSASYGVPSGASFGVEAWNAVHQAARNIGDGVRQNFAQIVRYADGDHLLSPNKTAMENTVLMSKAKPGKEMIQPLVAAACCSGTNDVDTSVESIGVDDRPVANLLGSVNFTWGFDYFKNLLLSDVDGGVTIWECADQDSVLAGDSTTWKPCAVIDCGEKTSVEPYATVGCAIVDIFQQLTHPELVDAFIRTLSIAHARMAEQELLTRLEAGSTTVTYDGGGQGLLSSVEGIVGHLFGYIGYAERVDASQYALIVQPGFLDALVADEHRRANTKHLTKEQIVSLIKSYGISDIVEARDAVGTAETDITAAIAKYVDPGNVVAFTPCDAIGTWTVLAIPLEAFVRGEGTIVNAGFTTDASLQRQNKMQYFFEGKEFLEKKYEHIPHFKLELTASGTGVTAGAIEGECVPAGS